VNLFLLPTTLFLMPSHIGGGHLARLRPGLVRGLEFAPSMHGPIQYTPKSTIAKPHFKAVELHIVNKIV